MIPKFGHFLMKKESNTVGFCRKNSYISRFIPDVILSNKTTLVRSTCFEIWGKNLGKIDEGVVIEFRFEKILVSAFICNQFCEAVTSESWFIIQNIKKVEKKFTHFHRNKNFRWNEIFVPNWFDCYHIGTIIIFTRTITYT